MLGGVFLHLKGFERILAEFKTWRLEPLIGGRFWIIWEGFGFVGLVSGDPPALNIVLSPLLAVS